MGQPTILGIAADGNSRAYQANSNSGYSRVYSNIAIPSAANTVFILASIDREEDDGNIQSSAITGMTGATELFKINFTPENKFRLTQFLAYDVSECGALTAELTLQYSHNWSNDGITGVVCTDGFIESFLLHQDRNLDFSNMQAYSPNADDNILLNMGTLDGTSTVTAGVTYSGTGVTEIYKVLSDQGAGTDHIAAVAAFQATNGTGDLSNVKTILREGVTNDLMDVSVVICSQPDPFDGITGKLTSPIIK